MAADEPASAETTARRETSTRWAHKGLAGPWWLALLLIPLLLAALLAWAEGEDIEGDLKARPYAALAAYGWLRSLMARPGQRVPAPPVRAWISRRRLATSRPAASLRRVAPRSP